MLGKRNFWVALKSAELDHTFEFQLPFDVVA
jgi:hypothetical protein